MPPTRAAGDLRFWEYNVGVSVGWELDFWGKFRRSIEAADANLLASIAGYDNVLVLLVAQVADTYVAIRSAEAQLKVARENIAIQQRSVRITEARFRGGDVGELDVLQARTQLLGTQATIPPLETGLQQAKNALSTLLGQPPGSLAEILGPQPGVIPAAPQAIAAGAPTDLLRRRPDVRQAELAAATQSAVVGVAEADLYPSFGLSGFLGVVAADGTNTTRTGNSGFGQLFNANSLTFFGGPYFSWNILNYGRIRNNVRVQDAQLQQLLENYQSTVLNAVKEVEDGMVAFLHSREQERILAETEVSAQRSLDHRERRVPRRSFPTSSACSMPRTRCCGCSSNSSRRAARPSAARSESIGRSAAAGRSVRATVSSTRRPGTPCKSAWTGAICCNRRQPSRR